VGGNRGKMSSFPDPLELKELEGKRDEAEPNVHDRVTAVPGEVTGTAPDGFAGEDDPISGLQRKTPEEALPSFREPVPDDDLPPVLGRSAGSTRAPKATKVAERDTGDESWKSTGVRRSTPKRPVLELELDDIPSTVPPPQPRPDALEAPLPQRAPTKAPLLKRPSLEAPPAPEAPPEPPTPEPFPLSRPPVRPEVLDMRDRYATGDFTGALVVAEALLESNPDHEEARRCHERCTETLSQMYMARLGSPAQAVRVVVPSEQIRWLSLDHRAGFLLSLVDGASTIEELLDISGMPRLDALRILYGLLDQRVIALCER
jgi:hypothetical protein